MSTTQDTRESGGLPGGKPPGRRSGWATAARRYGPIVVVLVMFGVLVFLSGTAAAPFIYTLF